MSLYRLTLRRRALQEATIDIEADGPEEAIKKFGLRNPGYLPWAQDKFESPAVVNVEEVDA